MEIKKMKWLAYLMVPFVAVAISCKDDDDDDIDNGNGGNTGDGRNEVVIEEITQSNLAVIEMGTTAATGAEDSLVQAFGQMMIAEYDRAQDHIDSIAENREIDLPSDLNNEHQQLSDSLDSLSGSLFDSVYIFSQIAIHTELKNLYETIADTTTDQALKDYVNLYLPVIIDHLQKADSIAFVLFGYTGGDGGNGGGNGGGNDTTGVGGDTTGVGGDTTGVGGDATTGVGGDTTGVGGDTTDVGNDTTDVGTDTTDVGDTSNVAGLLELNLESTNPISDQIAALKTQYVSRTALSSVGREMEPATVPKEEPIMELFAVRESSEVTPESEIT